MTQAVAPTTDTYMAKVRAFVLSIVPSGTEVLRAPIDRAAMPKSSCVIMTDLFAHQLRTNIHTDTDPFPSTGGSTSTEMGTEKYIQLDFYGRGSSDWSVAAAMLWRDEYGCNMLNPEVSPLYTDDARMVPLVTGEEQYFERYALTVHLQWNPVTVTPQQFADTANVVLIEVDSTYPP